MRLMKYYACHMCGRYTLYMRVGRNGAVFQSLYIVYTAVTSCTHNNNV